MFAFFRNRRRRKLRSRPFPDAWLDILRDNFPIFETLPGSDRAELLGHIQVFLAEKNFEGCGGLEMTDEIRVTIAAQACLLLLHRDTDYYPRLHSILVYPHPYLAKSIRVTEGGVVHEESVTRLGESWTLGSLVLAWDSVEHGGEHASDGENVVFHEFADQLDGEDGLMSGSPELGRGLRLTERRSKYVSWIRVFKTEFEHLRFMEEHNRRSLIDFYGATNAAEFFAVVTEVFFERPTRLREEHPELYAELRDFYRQDPATWGR